MHKREVGEELKLDLNLNLDDLQVQSFVTSPESSKKLGTVIGQAAFMGGRSTTILTVKLSTNCCCTGS